MTTVKTPISTRTAFRIRTGKNAAVFVKPGGFFRRIVLLWRGYRPNGRTVLWAKMNTSLKAELDVFKKQRNWN